MKNRLVILLALLILPVSFIYSQAKKPLTLFESSGGLKTPRYDETIDYCKKLTTLSPLLKYTTFGVSPQGRELPLLIADKNGNFTPATVKKSGNAVLLIQACIHAGEPDGKDAGMMLLRDICVAHQYPSLLDHLTILFIPIFNVDGHERYGAFNRINQNGPEEMGWRTTAQNYNLNRDYLKADAPEMKAWLNLYTAWLPDFFVDCHVTDGADYQYVLTYSLETHGDLDEGLQKWILKEYEPYVSQNMPTKGFPIFPYVEFRNWHDPRSGLETATAPPMLSHGYVTAQNRPGLLIETHMLKPYKQRVESTYEMLKETATVVNKEYSQLKKLVSEADLKTSSSSFRSQPFPLSYKVSHTDSTMSDFKGFEYTMEKSDLSGGMWFKYDNTKPITWKIPMFENNLPDIHVHLPEAYIIPPQYQDIIAILKLHGVKLSKIDHTVVINVSTYRFAGTRWQQAPYENHHKTTFRITDSTEKRTFPAGSVIIDMNQRTARVIAHLLEPASPDSFVSWGMFDGLFEQKEYSESYVMESLGRKMLKEDPALRQEFEKKKSVDPSFANNPNAILNWFYSKSPYWDQNLNVYPIGRIMKSEELQKIRARQ